MPMLPISFVCKLAKLVREGVWSLREAGLDDKEYLDKFTKYNIVCKWNRASLACIFHVEFVNKQLAF